MFCYNSVVIKLSNSKPVENRQTWLVMINKIILIKQKNKYKNSKHYLKHDVLHIFIAIKLMFIEPSSTFQFLIRTEIRIAKFQNIKNVTDIDPVRLIKFIQRIFVHQKIEDSAIKLTCFLFFDVE